MTETPIFDEMWGNDGQLRAPYARFQTWLDSEDPKRLRAKQREADDLFRLSGITFNVYGRSEAEERLIPFDIIPRIISATEWQRLSRGIEQRVRAINAFLFDIYNGQEIIKAGRIPRAMIAQNEAFLPHMLGLRPPGGSIPISWASIWCAPGLTSFMCSKITRARLRVSAICWKTVKPCCRCFPNYSRAMRCSRCKPIRWICCIRWRPARQKARAASPRWQC